MAWKPADKVVAAEVFYIPWEIRIMVHLLIHNVRSFYVFESLENVKCLLFHYSLFLFQNQNVAKRTFYTNLV